MYIALGLLQIFVGLSAMAGGFMLIKDTSGAAMGLPATMLEGSIFPNFLVPGLFLFVINGLGSLLGSLLSFTRHRYAGQAAIALGAVLVTWLFVQVSIIRAVHWLHALIFVLGIVEVVIGLLIARRPMQAAKHIADAGGGPSKRG